VSCITKFLNNVKVRSLWLRALLGIYFIGNLYRYLTKQDNFNILYAGAVRYSEGATVHLNEHLAFTYPSFFSLLLSPLTLFGYDVALIVFFVISFVVLILGFRFLSDQLIEKDLARRGIVLVLVVAGSFRFFQGVFDDQQTDLLVFGAILLGSKYLVDCKNWRTPTLWAFAGAIKANPMFMIVPLLVSSRARQVIIFIMITIFLWMLPDVISPLLPKTTNPKQFELPSVVIDHGKDLPVKTVTYSAVPQKQKDWPRYIREWVNFNLGVGSKVSDGTKTNGSWWNQNGNAQNQAITQWTAVYLGAGKSYMWVFVSWTLFLAILLAILIRRRGLDLVTVLLSYQAFVLLGPVSSKPHFLPVIGLLMFVWNRAVKINTKAGYIVPGIITFLLAITTPDLIGFKAYNFLGGIGFYGWLVFGLWTYVYYILWPSETKIHTV